MGQDAEVQRGEATLSETQRFWSNFTPTSEWVSSALLGVGCGGTCSKWGFSRQNLEDEGELGGRGYEEEGVLGRGTACAEGRPRHQGGLCGRSAVSKEDGSEAGEGQRPLVAWRLRSMEQSEMASHPRHAAGWKILDKACTR